MNDESVSRKGKKSNAGRKDAWSTIIEPNLDKIKKWYKEGVLEKDIIAALGIQPSTFYKYKAEKTELMNIEKQVRAIQCNEIQNALYKRALGFFETDTKTYWRKPRGAKEDQAEYVYKEDSKKYYPPDVTAGLILLKHWDDKIQWTNDPQLYELKKTANEVEAITKLKDKWIDLDDIEDGKKLLKKLREDKQ